MGKDGRGSEAAQERLWDRTPSRRHERSKLFPHLRRSLRILCVHMAFAETSAAATELMRIHLDAPLTTRFLG
jgi:hypothetical protein